MGLITTKSRLAIMMFLQYFIWGAWYVTAYPVLSKLGFGADEIKWTYSAGPIAAIISPFFAGIISDRWLATQKLLFVLHLLAGIFLLLAIVLATQTGVGAVVVNAAILLHMIFYMPTIALTNTITLRHVNDPKEDFPRIRFFGGIGWISAAALISSLSLDTSVMSFYIASATALVMACYSLTLPSSPPTEPAAAVSVRSILGLDALSLLRERNFSILLGAMFLVFIPMSFYFQLAASFVEWSGVKKIAMVMSLGQISELVFILALPFLLRRYSIKTILVVGCMAWTLRYAIFSTNYPEAMTALIVLGILLHGPCYDFCFVTGTIYIDKAVPRSMQAQAQGLFMLVTYGLVLFVGAQIAGIVEGFATDSSTAEIQWNIVWAVPTLIAFVVTVLFSVLFQDKTDKSENI